MYISSAKKKKSQFDVSKGFVDFLRHLKFLNIFEPTIKTIFIWNILGKLACEKIRIILAIF